MPPVYRVAVRPLLIAALLLAAAPFTSGRAAQSADSRLEYRIVFATANQLARQLDVAGREGFGCLAVAHEESGTALPGVVVLLGRQVDGPRQAVGARVTIGGNDAMQKPLSTDGAEGFRLCGISLDETPPNARLVAISTRTDAAPASTWEYRGEVLLNYRTSLGRLNASCKEGFVPVTAEAIADSRVAESRHWVVFAERSSNDATPHEIAVRSDPSPSGLLSNMNESGKQGYRADLLWKEGNDFVAMMSRPSSSAHPAVDFIREDDIGHVHFLSRRPLGDFAYLDRRVVFADNTAPAENELVEDELPPPGAVGYAEPRDLNAIATHFASLHGYAPAYAHVRRAKDGSLLLSVMLTRRAR